MLTDAEVADTARQLLADELADLTPPAALLSAVRCRHAVGRRRRRAATATLACAAAAGVTAATPGCRAAAARPLPDRSSMRVRPNKKLRSSQRRDVVGAVLVFGKQSVEIPLTLRGYQNAGINRNRHSQ